MLTYRAAPVRPLIGLTTYAAQARFGLHDTFAAVLPLTYVRAVHAAGGRAVLITPDDPDTDVLDRLDGLLLTGGPDVEPARYGERPHPATYLSPERDEAELILLRAALDNGLPVLGICRGMQLMAVAYGGRLHQHLPDLLGHHGHRPLAGREDPDEPTGAQPRAAQPRAAQPRARDSRPSGSDKEMPSGSDKEMLSGSDKEMLSGSDKEMLFGGHPVTLAPGSQVHKILGDALIVNSFHHQGVADPGRLTPVGWCPQDELIEVVEDPSQAFTIGVQWHPEDTGDPRLFDALVQAARAYRSRQAAHGPETTEPGPRDQGVSVPTRRCRGQNPLDQQGEVGNAWPARRA